MIGAIADDFTGATDIAVAFRRAGLRAVVLFGQPETDSIPDGDVTIIALKTRTVEPQDAVEQSLRAVTWLRSHGASQIFFKYCSTFDSRAEGNIGPVADALSDELNAQRVVFAPSSPEHLRTQYMGHLFVDRVLLSDSPMRHHPLTPMTDSFIPSVLQAQTPHTVGLLDYRDVAAGRRRITERLEEISERGARFVVVDAIDQAQLAEIGAVCIDDVFVTGAAGMAGGLGQAHASRLGRTAETARESDPFGDVPAVVLAGSCSARTLEQISHMQSSHPSYQLDAVLTPDSKQLAAAALEWFDHQPVQAAPLIYSSLPPEQLRQTQTVLGADRASDILETAMGLIAKGLVERGVKRVIVAGGETSGAVVTALHVDAGVVGEEAAPGVPWIYTAGESPIALLLKSGNFGDPELLTRAVGVQVA